MAILTRYTSRPILNATRARQGRFGRHMFWVLLVSTALAALALFGAWSWRAGDLASTEPSNAREKADAAPFQMGEPVALQKAPLPAAQAGGGTHPQPGNVPQ